MMIKTTLLPLLSIAPCISLYAMEQSNPLLIIEKFRTIPILEQKKFQDPYPLWEKITVTAEFINCVKILQHNNIATKSDYEKAFKLLHATKEYKAYMVIQKSLEQEMKK